MFNLVCGGLGGIEVGFEGVSVFGFVWMVYGIFIVFVV